MDRTDHRISVNTRNSQDKPQAETPHEPPPIRTDQIPDNATIKTRDSDAENSAEDEEGRVGEKEEGFFGVEGGDDDAEEGAELVEEGKGEGEGGFR